jgi:hypothetical protein
MSFELAARPISQSLYMLADKNILSQYFLAARVLLCHPLRSISRRKIKALTGMIRV